MARRGGWPTSTYAGGVQLYSRARYSGMLVVRTDCRAEIMTTYTVTGSLPSHRAETG